MTKICPNCHETKAVELFRADGACCGEVRHDTPIPPRSPGVRPRNIVHEGHVYEPTGEVRPPRKGEHFLYEDPAAFGGRAVCPAVYDHDEDRIIMRDMACEGAAPLPVTHRTTYTTDVEPGDEAAIVSSGRVCAGCGARRRPSAEDPAVSADEDGSPGSRDLCPAWCRGMEREVARRLAAGIWPTLERPDAGDELATVRLLVQTAWIAAREFVLAQPKGGR